jgi:hypothetical protein
VRLGGLAVRVGGLAVRVGGLAVRVGRLDGWPGRPAGSARSGLLVMTESHRLDDDAVRDVAELVSGIQHPRAVPHP